MKRIIALVLLACLCGQAAADIVMLLDPAGKPVAAGKYRLLAIPADATKPPVSTVIDVGGTVIPPGPPPGPPVDDTTAKITGYLAAVTAPDKAATSAKLVLGYKATIGFADAGTITDAAALKTIQQMVDKQLTSKSASAWKPWTDGMTTLVAPMDLPATLAAYKIALATLGGAPPPNPPDPPGPTSAVAAVILLESENQTAEQATLINQARNDKAWSKLIRVLDPNQKNEANQPDPQAQAAVKACGASPLPRLLLQDAAGGFVGSEALPATWDATKAVLTGKGVKP
jgi:hypothetical protein